MSKFKVGQKVKVKENFYKIEAKYDPGVVDEMLEYAGREDKISRIIDPDGLYKLESDIWSWAEEWLEEPDKEIKDSDVISVLEEV